MRKPRTKAEKRSPSPLEGGVNLTAPLLALFLAACASAPPPRAEESFPPDSALFRGRAVYERWCAACHDPGPEHPGTLAMRAKYDDRPDTIEDWTDLPPETTKLVVRQGVYTMAFFRPTEIGDAELDDLAAYLARNTR